MTTAELLHHLSHHEQERYIVLRDPDSGLIHALKFLIEESAFLNGNQDFRCGPHNLAFKTEGSSPILHFGQQTWPSGHRYPDTPDVQTVAKLATHLQERDPDPPAVIGHYFDEFIDIDTLIPIDGAARPTLWGNPGSGVRPWPEECRKHPPDRVLLLTNSVNESYSRLRKAHTQEVYARALLMESREPVFKDLNQLPIDPRTTMSSEDLRAKHTDALQELRDAQDHFERVLTAPVHTDSDH